VLKIAADMKTAADEGLEDVVDADGYVTQWMREVGSGVPGYQTPKVAVGAAVTNDRGQLLLIRRADSGVWLYPTGLVRRWLLGARSCRKGSTRRDRY